jgi:calcineurin-like phosphoesterase family protein
VKRRVVLLLLTALALQCGKSSPTSPTPPDGHDPPPGSQTAVLVGAGDIGLCGSAGALATGRLVEATLGEVFLAGDIAYPNGSAQAFRECFEPYWGLASDRWRPVPGNHEYESPNAAPYFTFFGPTAGPPGLGYYRFVAGEWLVLMLNSNIDASATSAQYQFVRESFQGRPFRCQMAIWHHPLYSSGPNGPHPHMKPIYQLLFEQGVDVVVNAHDHLYERFSRQDADGRQVENGIRQFIVGTGGATLTRAMRATPNSAIVLSTYGIMRFTLRADSYDWEFLETAGSLGDNGSTPCH